MKAGWAKTTIGATFTTVTGGTPSKSNEGFYGDFIPLVKPPELRGSELDSAEDGLSEAGAAVARIAPRHSILVSCIGNLGKVGLNTIPVAFNQQINAIFPDGDKALPSFMLYQVLSCSFKEQLESQASGTTVPIVNKSKFNSIEIVLPPLPEQQRIVAILDEAFEAIAAARANAEQNRQNAHALFESYLQSVFSQRGEGWVNKKLGDACVVERGSSPRPIKQYLTTDSDGVNWIKIGDTEQGGKYVYSSSQKITLEGAKQSRLVREGDFILTNSMSLGRPYIMKTSGYIHDGWFVLRLGKDIDPEFFYYLLSSTYVQNQFHTLAAGAIVKNISGDLVKKALLPIPTLEQQKLLVKGFITFSAQTQRLESLYQRKIAALDELKQSLLQQAFSGQL